MSAIVEKYRQAGIIAQNALSVVISQLHKGIGEQSVGEVCRMGDEYIMAQAARCFKTVTEKGVARPVEICKNDFVSGIAPDAHDTFQAGIVSEGDVVKVTLGVHIDGFTVMAGHTVIIREEQPPAAPVVGPDANSAIAAYLATEAVVSLLSSVISDTHSLHHVEVTGRVVRQVVEDIAAAFGSMVVPGSRVRRIKRFVAGQPTVRDSLPNVEWREHSEDDETKLVEELDAQFQAKPGHTYLIDISMAPRLEQDGYIKLAEVPSIGSAIEGPSIYTRDHTVTYQLRTAAGRQLLGAADKQLSVFPFKLGYLANLSNLSINQIRLGVNECVQRHLLAGDPRLRAAFVPEYRTKEAAPVTTAREVATLSLVPGQKSGSGYPEVLRLSGGRFFPPSWTHSERALGPGLAADALNARLTPHQGLKYVEIKPTQRSLAEPPVDQDMAIEA